MTDRKKYRILEDEGISGNILLGNIDNNSYDCYLYVEKNGHLEQCKYESIVERKPIRINKDNVLYCKKFTRFDFLNSSDSICFDNSSKDSLDLTKENLKKYKFYKFDTFTNNYKRIYIDQNKDGAFVSQDIKKETFDAGDDNSPTKLKNSDINKIKQEVEKLKKQENIASSNYQRLDDEYLRLLIQFHNTNYNVQEYKQKEYVKIYNDREFKKGVFQKSKTGYYFDIKDQNNDIPKRYYFFNEKKKEELKKLMQSCDELIPKNKFEVDEEGNILSLL